MGFHSFNHSETVYQALSLHHGVCIFRPFHRQNAPIHTCNLIMRTSQEARQNIFPLMCHLNTNRLGSLHENQSCEFGLVADLVSNYPITNLKLDHVGDDNISNLRCCGRYFILFLSLLQSARLRSNLVRDYMRGKYHYLLLFKS